ncbi:deaminase domain-containing protein [Tenacibaculum singaporense]|uniref:deaminase domain-containing protein n=1 Tax=Tenacibaculum singaporense TaxID=2358479 RepID=UPI003513505C
MKKFRILLLLFLAFSNLLFGQCIVDDLAKDFSRNSELKNVLSKKENFDAWALLNKENPALRTSDIEIRFVADNLEDIKSFGGYDKWRKNYEDINIPTTFTFETVKTYENPNELAKTFDPNNKLSKHHRGLIYNYYNQASKSNGLKAHLWKKIEDIFNEYKLNWGWPLANGGYNAFDKLLKEKEVFDRLGGVLRNTDGSIKFDKNGFPELGGTFTSPVKDGVPYNFESRALRGERTDYDFYYKIEVIDPKGIETEVATVIPWFGRKGGAQQSMWKTPIDPSTGYPKTWNKLAEEGYVKITIEDVPSGKAEFLKFKGKVIGGDPYLVIKNKFPENLRNLLKDAPEEFLTNFKKLDDDGKLEKFIDDFKDNTDAFLSFKETPSLVDSWKVISNGKASLRNLENVKGIDLFKQSNPDITYDAIKNAFESIKSSGTRRQAFINALKSCANNDKLIGSLQKTRLATIEEIKDALNKIRDYRTGKAGGGNYGYLEGIVNGRVVDNAPIRSGNVIEGEPQIFEAIPVTGSDGTTWLRNTDSEYKMLNKLASDIGGIKGQIFHDVSGNLKIISENPYCSSCQGIVQQFSNMFPNIEITLIDGVR